MNDPGDGSALRIGFLGRVPPALGGAGLELQMERTAEALERLGHEVVQVDAAGREAKLDVLHAFGSEPAVWHQLRHWTRNRVPLVVTSVVVVSPGLRELLLRLSTRVPGVATSGRMRAELLGRSDVVIAAGEYEARLVARLGARRDAIEILGNGGDPVEPGEPPGALPERYALMVGSVSGRKRQVEVARALAGGGVPLVVAGGFAGADAARGETERALAGAGARWLGEVSDRRVVAALQRDAVAMVQLSDAEVQSLAVLEALAQATPVIASDIPSHRELAERYPGWVRVVGGAADVPGELERLTGEAVLGAPPTVPTWEAVAERLIAIYRRLLAR